MSTAVCFERSAPLSTSLWRAMLLSALMMCAFLLSPPINAQTINTFAGGETSAALSTAMSPQGVVTDSAGNIFIADGSNNRIRKVSPSGVVTTLASGLNGPWNIALDSSGNVYFTDRLNHLVRKITPAGIISTVAGNGAAGFAGDGGPATSASLNGPRGLAISITGDIFIGDFNNCRIRRVFTDGTITTYAGTATCGYSGNGGAATAAQMGGGTGLAIKSDGTLFVAEEGNSVVRRISSSGTITLFAGTNVSGFSGDGGPATSAQLNLPAGLALDASGNVYISDFGNSRIRRVSTSGTIVTWAGSGAFGFSGDGGLASAANIATPLGLSVDASGTLFMAVRSNARIRTVSAAGIINTVAGNGTEFFGVGDDGAAAGANLQAPTAVNFDAAGNAYIADSGNNRVRKVTPAGIISTLAGTGTAGSTGDAGTATSATLNRPTGVVVDGGGNVYISETSGHRIRKVTPAGIISTYAGTGTAGFGGDGGAASSASINSPRGLAVDSAGNLYIADYGNNRIRRVSAAGTIITVAGTGTAGFSGDSGLATLANISGPYGVGVDAAGNVWIPDTFNNRIRRVSTAGIITTVAGTGTSGFSGDGGSALSANMANPTSVKFDASGNAYFADASNQRIRKITSAGVISTIAGNGTIGFSGDGGLATAASFNFPYDAALDAAGNVYVPDINNNRVRRVTGLNAPPRVVNDLNGDGKSDIVYKDASGVVGVALMNGVSAFASNEILPAGSGWSVTHIADFNGDGKADILIKNTDGRIAVLLMNGTAVLSFNPIVPAGSGYTPVVTGDFNGDGKADIVVKNVDGSSAVLLMNGGAVASAGFVLGAGSTYNVTHAGDLNGDGKTDLIIRQADGTTATLIMDGSAVASAGLLLTAGSPWSVTHVADLSGDGKADVIIRNTDNSAALLLMNGTTVTAASLLLTAGSPYTVTHTGDFNGDGKADILIRHTDASVVILLMNGTTVSSAALLLTPGSSFTVTQVADYNGDGKSDVFFRATDGSGYAATLNGTTVLLVGTVWGAGTVQTVP